ncbi:MAG: hypothetical protein P4L99_08620 [Chthoniobacter sp.]|nr:hypothetical protein [Chthoniobacter sp.]
MTKLRGPRQKSKVEPGIHGKFADEKAVPRLPVACEDEKQISCAASFR